MSGDVGWEDQRAFLAVVEAGSLSGAARRLGIAQPTVRARIETLERALGTSLFTRSVNGLVPTEQALALTGPARTMARASDAFIRAASAPAGEIAGTVRLSVSEFVGIEVLPAMLAGLRLAYPRIVPEISLSNASADVLDQEADIAIRMHAPLQGALLVKKVGAIPLGFFAHVDYLARRGTPMAVADLAGHDIIGPDKNRSDLRIAAAIDAGMTRERLAVRTDSHPAQLALVRAGLGIGVVQRPAGSRDPSLRAVLPDLEIGALETWIVTHEDLGEIPRVRVVFDHLIEGFTAYVRSR